MAWDSIFHAGERADRSRQAGGGPHDPVVLAPEPQPEPTGAPLPAGAFHVEQDRTYCDPWTNSALAMFAVFAPELHAQRMPGVYFRNGFGGPMAQFELVAALERLPHHEWSRPSDASGAPLPFMVAYMGPGQMYGVWLPPQER